MDKKNFSIELLNNESNDLIDIENLDQIECLNKLNKIATDKNYITYIDPYTNYSVFTSYYLKKKNCCGMKCRHCPWDWCNVKKK